MSGAAQTERPTQYLSEALGAYHLPIVIVGVGEDAVAH